MKQNKGFIGIGLIIAIVLGVVVVGGGAYYLGKSGEKKEVNNPQVNLPIAEEEKKQIDQNQNTSIVENTQTDCNSNSIPSITVLSPNGGEVFTAGDKVNFNVKWKSCNVPIDRTLSIAIDGYPSPSDRGVSLGFTSNSGSYVSNVPSTITPGKYTIHVGTTPTTYPSIHDWSDNLFTINSEKKDVSIGGESGDDINGKHIGFIKSIDSKNNLSIDYVQWISPCVAKASTGYCMNGFDVINDNTKIRSFPILDTAQIKLQTYSQNSSGNFNWNQVVSLSTFKKALNPDLLYWVTLKDGKIIEIIEQYRP